MLYFEVWMLNKVITVCWTEHLASLLCLLLFAESHRFCNRVQDSYTLRCCPQVGNFGNNCTGEATLKKPYQNTVIKQTGLCLFVLSLDKYQRFDPKNSMLR